MNDYNTETHPDRLPEPSSEEVGLGIEAVRQALDGKEVRMYRNNSGDLSVQYVSKSKPQTASS
jgi:hypothetical protein